MWKINSISSRHSRRRPRHHHQQASRCFHYSKCDVRPPDSKPYHCTSRNNNMSGTDLLDILGDLKPLDKGIIHTPTGRVFTPPKFSGHPQDQTITRGFNHCIHCNSTLSWPASAANEIWLAAVYMYIHSRHHASASLHCHLAAAAASLDLMSCN